MSLGKLAPIRVNSTDNYLMVGEEYPDLFYCGFLISDLEEFAQNNFSWGDMAWTFLSDMRHEFENAAQGYQEMKNSKLYQILSS